VCGVEFEEFDCLTIAERGEINSFAVDLNAQSVVVETTKNRDDAETIVKKAGKDTVFVEERA